jgi:hypothetical protein
MGFSSWVSVKNTPRVEASPTQFEPPLVLDDGRTEGILRDHMTMPARRWRQLKHSSLWISAEDAVEYGIANSIGDFSPPFGAQIYNI